MQLLKKFKPSTLILSLILIVAAILRFNALSFQSFWLDELHTAIEANPSLPWHGMFDYLRCCDQHPPLFFILERFSFFFFGHNELAARFISALTGIACVWTIYRLGKELFSEQLGLIAALLTCINYFNIYYAQEARDYELLWLMTTLSYLYFVRLVKNFKRSDAIWYIVTTTLLLYSHYFGLLVLFCQGVLAVIFWSLNKETRKKLFITFLITWLAIIALYIPWLPFLKEIANIKSFWIQRPKADFFISFFSEYFGNAKVLKPFLYAFILIFLAKAFLSRKTFVYPQSNSFAFSFIFIVISILCPYAILYIKSVTSVPVLISRYTTEVLPSIILALSFGIVFIPGKALRYGVLGIFTCLTLYNLIVTQKYYSTINKEQFREMTKYIATEKNNVPLINELTAWQQQYYLDRFHYTGTVFTGKKEDIIDSILHKSSQQYNIDTFWLVGAHGDPKLTIAKQRELDTAYTLINQKDYHDAWAQLYGKKK